MYHIIIIVGLHRTVIHNTVLALSLKKLAIVPPFAAFPFNETKNDNGDSQTNPVQKYKTTDVNARVQILL